RQLELLLMQALADGLDLRFQVTVEHDAIVDDRCDAVEQHALGGQLTSLGIGGPQAREGQSTGRQKGSNEAPHANHPQVELLHNPRFFPSSGSAGRVYPRMDSVRKVSAADPTLARPVSSSCRKTPVSCWPVVLVVPTGGRVLTKRRASIRTFQHEAVYSNPTNRSISSLCLSEVVGSHCSPMPAFQFFRADTVSCPTRSEWSWVGGASPGRSTL